MTADISEHELREIYQILQSLDNTPPPPEANRRAHARSAWRFAGAVILIGLSARPTICMVTRNISTGGFGFVSSRPFTKDELFAICLPPTTGSRKAVLCAARFCRYIKKGKYEIGAEFVEVFQLGKDPNQLPAAWIQRATKDKPRVVGAAS